MGLAALLLAILIGGGAQAGEPRRQRPAVAAASASVVAVLPQWPAQKRRSEEPEGSGVAVLDGHYILTAAHVIADAQAIRIVSSDGQVMAATLAARDEATDLALLRIDDQLPALSFGGDAELGEEACILGNAFGLGLSVSCGTVSAVHRSGTGFNAIEDFVQTDAAANPGTSGGALVALDGTLLGIVSAIFTKQSDANIGVNFAVSAPLAGRVARALRDRGRVEWLAAGMRLEPAPAPGALGPKGARVALVRDGSVAAAAGIEVDDLIVQAARQRVSGPADFVGALARFAPPATLAIILLRDGQKRQLMLEFK